MRRHDGNGDIFRAAAEPFGQPVHGVFQPQDSKKGQVFRELGRGEEAERPAEAVASDGDGAAIVRGGGGDKKRAPERRD